MKKTLLLTTLISASGLFALTGCGCSQGPTKVMFEFENCTAKDSDNNEVEVDQEYQYRAGTELKLSLTSINDTQYQFHKSFLEVSSDNSSRHNPLDYEYTTSNDHKSATFEFTIPNYNCIIKLYAWDTTKVIKENNIIYRVINTTEVMVMGMDESVDEPTTLAIPDTVSSGAYHVTTINNYAFRHVSTREEKSKIKTITFGESLRCIKDYAFNGSYQLETVTFDNTYYNLNTLGAYAFADCPKLLTVSNIDCKNCTPGDYSFSECGGKNSKTSHEVTFNFVNKSYISFNKWNLDVIFNNTKINRLR